ncbi:hypothetical protein [Paludisphaera rhizosphaerae]|uniref:hypothetical protein n=1 Tax=Paludisphaera rhizosphaerae TaxID=2711216 RepID=UPI0013EA0C0B|nr:hypothetical protein [Paludisphaera rhizosphaerae]
MELESRSDVALARQAFAGGWITDNDTRISLRQQLEKIALDPKVSPREKTSALKALLAAERLALTEREVSMKERLSEGGAGDNILALVSLIEARGIEQE